MKRLFRFLLTLSMLMPLHEISAQTFDEYFCDSTLRIDYIFAGDSSTQEISVSKLNLMPRWFGKRQRLAEMPVEGNGQISVSDHRTGQVVYRNSFSTLFQEWQSYDEAKHARKAFENVFLVPYPKDTVDIRLDLRNNRRQIIASYSFTMVPNDILVRHIGFSRVTPYTTVQQAADTTKCIHIAFLAEGYKTEEMDVFLNDVDTAVQAIFAHEPFKSQRSKFNIVAVKSPSADSGTSEPSKGIWRNTALHSHFDTFYSNRYLTTLHLFDMHDLLAGTPYEHIIVLVNTSQYGGGGILNSYNLSMTHNKYFKPVVVHEFGHSFAGLGDEYAYEQELIPMYPKDIEPWEQNLTTLVDFKSKWADMVAPGTPIPTKPDLKHPKVGAYLGAGYDLEHVYRSYPDCRMRTNLTPDFCPVCQRAITKLINFYTE